MRLNVPVNCWHFCAWYMHILVEIDLKSSVEQKLGSYDTIFQSEKKIHFHMLCYMWLRMPILKLSGIVQLRWWWKIMCEMFLLGRMSWFQVQIPALGKELKHDTTLTNTKTSWEFSYNVLDQIISYNKYVSNLFSFVYFYFNYARLYRNYDVSSSW